MDMDKQKFQLELKASEAESNARQVKNTSAGDARGQNAGRVDAENQLKKS